MRPGARNTGFSLIELVIVVAILGVVAAIAVPKMSRAAEGAGVNAFSSSLSQIVTRFEEEYTLNGEWPDQQPGLAVPDEIADQFHGERGTQFTMFGGGSWRYKNTGGNLFLCAMFLSAPDEDRLAQVDAIVDDGNLATGRFRKKNPTQYEYHFE